MRARKKLPAGASVGQVMTRTPLCVDPYELLSVARDRMVEHDLHHLPVVDGGVVVGVVTARDIDTLERCPHVSLAQATVASAMRSQPFVVSPSAPLASTARSMAARRLGSAVVVGRGGVPRGIFTTVDALRTLATLLEERAGATSASPRSPRGAGAPRARASHAAARRRHHRSSR